LGEVYLDTNGLVTGILGNKGTPPDPSVLAEKELRSLLFLLDESPGPDSTAFDPKIVVRIVNRLQPLGKTKALAAIQEFTRIKPDSESWRGMHLILRALFDVPESGHFPGIHVGATSPERPADANLIPRFPLVIVDDIPLLLPLFYYGAGGVDGRGVPPDFAFFRDSCSLRQRPLMPTARPFSVLERIMESKQWIYSPSASNWAEAGLVRQLCKLTSTVYDPSATVKKHLAAWSFQLQLGWTSLLKETESLDIHWDVTANCYVFRDGSTLATKKPASRK
jgi:hypothetical protein